MPLREAARRARRYLGQGASIAYIGCEVMMPLSFAPSAPALSLLWLITLVDPSMLMPPSPTSIFLAQYLLEGTLRAVYNLS